MRWQRFSLLVASLGWLVFLPAASVAGAEEAPHTSLGKKIANFALTDVREQKSVALADFQDKKAFVVFFLGTECPINNNYLLRVTELSREYAPQGVQFLAIYANPQDGADKAAAHARKYELPFPVLRDGRQTIADLFAARRVPEAFVLDGGRTVRYQGRIDDRFGIGYQRPKPTRHDLAEALNEVLAGKPVTQPQTPVAGCLITRRTPAKAVATITYNGEVARILQTNCQECHRPGQVGPFALRTYEDASAWSAMIREVVQDGRMPPWYADSRHGKFANDRSLPPADREKLLTWIDQGCPRGDGPELSPRQFPEGWSIGKPDVVFTMPDAFEVPAEAPRGGIAYQYYRVPTNFTEDRWVQAAEAKAGAPEVVHHIVVFILPPGQVFDPLRPGLKVLCGTAPGDMPYRAPHGYAKKVPAGSQLVFQMHYTANGRKQKDRSSCGLIFSREPVERQILTVPVANPAIRVPAGAANHPVESRFVFRDNAQILSFMPHMHLRGKDFRYEVIYPDGKKETLLWVPRYNFNWQSVYRLEKPHAVPKGTVLHCVAHFDNSADNPSNPDPTRVVRWGDQTWEEMMIGWTDFAYDRKPE